MDKYTNVDNDLQIIEDLFTDLTFNELCEKIGISETDYLAIKHNETTPTKLQLENIYNFAYQRGLYLNEISWQESEDIYSTHKNEFTCHGSRTNISGDIRLDKSGESNDFASGFYMGRNISQAAMFVADEPNSSLYTLTFNPDKLIKTQFNVSVDWMLAICWYRGKIPEYKNSNRLKKVTNKVDSCDYILAPIADNNMFEVIDAFSEGVITDLQCLYALSATHLGYQFVLKTEKCLEQLEIKEHLYYCSIQKSFYSKKADVDSNTSMNKALIAKKKYANSGKYINELLKD